MFGELVLTAGIALIAYALYRLFTNSARYFQERNLKYRGAVAQLSGFISITLGKNDILSMVQNSYNAFPDQPIYGAFDASLRLYVVRNPEVFKRIAVKDFDHFEDHRSFFKNDDDLFGSGLISLEGEKWRQMRATLSPAFTGSKMRQMFGLISDCADEIVQSFTKKTANGEKVNVEIKDFFSRYTNDVIATCAFGVKVNSFADPNNEFYTNGKKLTGFAGGFIPALKFLMLFMLPKLFNMLNLRLFDASLTKFFKNMVLDTMETRQTNNILRPDMINMLMQVRQGHVQQESDEKINGTDDGFATVEESDIGKMSVTRKWSDNEIVAQCFLFFFAGFEISSTMLTFTAYELIANPDVQQKLYEEIVDVNEQLGGKQITYDVLQKMQYLDQVVSEVLRKWPTAAQLDRICVKDYTYDDGEGLKFKIEKGSHIICPIFGIHRDPKYYPNPEQFDPDRFSDANKDNIVPGSYAPFGVGPRNCIGSRFALMEIKAILYVLLLNFSFEANKDTQIPLKLKKGPAVIIENGVHLELKPRTK